MMIASNNILFTISVLSVMLFTACNKHDSFVDYLLKTNIIEEKKKMTFYSCDVLCHSCSQNMWETVRAHQDQDFVVIYEVKRRVSKKYVVPHDLEGISDKVTVKIGYDILRYFELNELGGSAILADSRYTDDYILRRIND